ncbi:hypothetical protein GGI43DRAFT_416986 [Trichoderma evansii]
MAMSRVHVLFISGTLLGRTSYIVADSPWPNHMDDSRLVSSTMSPPLGATRHGRTWFASVWGAIQANCWPVLQQGPDPRFACADGGRGMAQRAGALVLIEGFSLIWCLCLLLQLSAESRSSLILSIAFLFRDSSSSSIESTSLLTDTERASGCLALTRLRLGEHGRGRTHAKQHDRPTARLTVDTKTAEEDRVPSGEVGRRRRLAVGQKL